MQIKSFCIIVLNIKKTGGFVALVHIGVIGVGNMAKAILNGIAQDKAYHIWIYDIDPEKTAAFSGGNLHIADSLAQLAAQSEYILLAVKPQNMPDVLAQLGECVASQPVYVSIAAGVSTSRIRYLLQSERAKVVRLMPNTPMLLGYGATAACATENVTDAEYAVVARIFEASGLVRRIPESQMDAVTSVNGSSPAYLFRCAKAVVSFAQENGISADIANTLFCGTLIGSAKMLMDSGMDADALIKMVSSPGGTTVEALRVFEEQGFTETIRAAMKACADRAAALGK